MVFRLATSTVTAFPEAQVFIEHLLDRGISEHVAAEYARLVAKLVREGRAATPEFVTQRNARTAINAYWEWIEAAYTERVRPVIRALVDADVTRGISWLRRSSLVPPREGKTIPRLAAMPQLHLDADTRAAHSTAAEIVWVPSAAWTLHVPRAPLAVHEDPCGNCTPIELDAAKLEVIAQAFEKAWGHRDLAAVPPECLLFGRPPRVQDPPKQDIVPARRILALLPAGALGDAVTQLGGAVVRDVEAFCDRLGDSDNEIVVISRSMAVDHRHELLQALSAAWDAHDAKRAAGRS